MTTNKKSFIIHTDLHETVSDMTDEQAGALFKAILEYNHTGTHSDVPAELRFLLKSLLSQFKRDNAKYEDVCAKRSAAGKKGAKQKLANAGKRKHKLANQADSDNDSDSDINITDSPNGSSVSETEPNLEEPVQEGGRDGTIDAWFDRVWEEYGRKGTKQAALKYWRKLKDADRTAIEKAIPAYVASRPDKTYRKDFNGWINPANRMWEDEIPKDETPKEDFLHYEQQWRPVDGAMKQVWVNREGLTKEEYEAL